MIGPNGIVSRETKVERITIAANEQIELWIQKPKEPSCDGQRTGLRATLTLVGPVSLSLVKTSKRRINEEKSEHRD